MSVGLPDRYDIEAIKHRLPHRYPFLMVDVIEESGRGFAIGIKNVSANEPHFQGHFPDRSIMPSVLITEALLQTSAFIGYPVDARNEDQDAIPDIENRAFGRQLLCVGFNMKFQKPVVPGDQLRMDVRFVRQIGGMTRIKGVAKTTAGVVASGDLILAAVAMTDAQTGRHRPER